MKNSFPFAAPSRRAGAWLSLILFPVVGGVGPLAWAQPSPIPRPEVWRPDGPVLAIAVDGDLAYLAGSFAYLGPPSGSAAVVSRA